MKIIKKQKGFSLVEMLLVVLLIFIIVALVSSLFITSGRTNRDVINIVRSEIDARLVLYRISKDIRETHDIITANNDEVIFLSNIDEDEYYERIRYYLIAEESHFNLYRQVDSTEARLYIKNIVDPDIFLYYSDLGVPADEGTLPVNEEELQNIRFVDMTVSIDQSGIPSVRTMELDTMITLRNRIY
ncbi:MAG: prepilin-type N-terminal cleavage/methylation domain-containing protein [Actinobacteria bacterium]|jgi:competence protein ComGC|nr:prepilin-type N-terminal cleavage/methylation domain-containing protein [Actinomycetota bacterium]